MDKLSDLEITKRCAEAMGYTEAMGYDKIYPTEEGRAIVRLTGAMSGFLFAPLHDDAQAMALVKKFRISCATGGVKEWTAQVRDNPSVMAVGCDDINRAICLCIARMP